MMGLSILLVPTSDVCLQSKETSPVRGGILSKTGAERGLGEIQAERKPCAREIVREGFLKCPLREAASERLRTMRPPGADHTVVSEEGNNCPSTHQEVGTSKQRKR